LERPLLWVIRHCSQPRCMLPSHGRRMRDGAQLKRRANVDDGLQRVAEGGAKSKGEASRLRALLESLRMMLLRCAGRKDRWPETPVQGWGRRLPQDDDDRMQSRCRQAELRNRLVCEARRQHNLPSLGSCGSRVGALWPLMDDAAGTRVLTLDFPFRRHHSNLALVLAGRWLNMPRYLSDRFIRPKTYQSPRLSCQSAVMSLC
jgi:hypothetical protein